MAFPDAVIYRHSNRLSSIALFGFDAEPFATVASLLMPILDTQPQSPNIYPEMGIA
jgi:hypothetical protein